MTPRTAGLTGAEALRRACLESRVPRDKRHARATQDSSRGPVPQNAGTREDRIVDEAFRILEPLVKGWVRARVREGSSVLESVAKLSRLLEAGGSIVTAVSGIAKAVQHVRKAAER